MLAPGVAVGGSFNEMFVGSGFRSNFRGSFRGSFHRFIDASKGSPNCFQGSCRHPYRRYSHELFRNSCHRSSPNLRRFHGYFPFTLQRAFPRKLTWEGPWKRERKYLPCTFPQEFPRRLTHEFPLNKQTSGEPSRYSHGVRPPRNSDLLPLKLSPWRHLRSTSAQANSV